MVSDSIDEEDEEISDQDFQVLKVPTDILKKVVEYCTHYQTVEKMNDIALPFNEGDNTVEKIVTQEWYSDFVKDEDFKTVNRLIAAANYMNISPLFNLACLSESVYIMGKSADELRKLYNIKKPQVTGEKEEKTEE